MYIFHDILDSAEHVKLFVVLYDFMGKFTRSFNK